MTQSGGCPQEPLGTGLDTAADCGLCLTHRTEDLAWLGTHKKKNINRLSGSKCTHASNSLENSYESPLCQSAEVLKIDMRFLCNSRTGLRRQDFIFFISILLLPKARSVVETAVLKVCFAGSLLLLYICISRNVLMVKELSLFDSTCALKKRIPIEKLRIIIMG